MQRLKTAIGFLLVIMVFGGLLYADHSLGLASDPIKLLPARQSKQAPDFELAEVATGRSVHLLDEVKHHPVVFTFWATWCNPCQMELPKLDHIARLYDGRVAVYGINSSDTGAEITAYTREHGLVIPMLRDPQLRATTHYDVRTIPRLFVVDTRGIVRAVADGYDPALESKLSPILDTLLKEEATGTPASNG